MLQVHVAAAAAALLLGPAVFLRPKGDRPHRFAGYLFVIAMVLANGSALAVYDVTGGPNFFHAMALVSLTTVSAGVVRARRGDIRAHQSCMYWAYAGLIIALANRLSPLLPLPFWLASLIIVLAVTAATHLIVERLISTADE